MKAKAWVLIIILSIAIKWVSLYPDFVENYYSNGLFPVISKLQRYLFGWVPFSIGDLFYGFLIIIIIFKTAQLFKTIYKKKFNKDFLLIGLKQLFFFFLLVYVLFYSLWGLNYNRLGVAKQFDLEVKVYGLSETDSLTGILVNKLNYYADRVNDKQFDSFQRKKKLFKESTDAYSMLAKEYPFLKYKPKSIKPSIYSYLGNYLGFQGYYNPFSGEAQANTTIPTFSEPFVACHEIGHQLGYAKENEASFIAYLACKNSSSDLFKYSLYFEMYQYALVELNSFDTSRIQYYQEQLNPLVIKHQKDNAAFYKKYRNPIEPIIAKLYGQYLIANNQPEGKRSYNMVVAWLIAWQKKYGADAL